MDYHQLEDATYLNHGQLAQLLGETPEEWGISSSVFEEQYEPRADMAVGLLIPSSYLDDECQEPPDTLLILFHPNSTCDPEVDYTLAIIGHDDNDCMVKCPGGESGVWGGSDPRCGTCVDVCDTSICMVCAF